MKKRLVAVALTALTPAVGMLAYNEFSARSERNAEVHRQAAQLARQAASEVGSVIEGVKGLLVATAAIPSIANPDATACDTVLKTVVEKLAPVRNLIVLDKTGKLVCDSMGWEAGTDFSDRRYVQDALRTSDVVVGDYTMSRVSKTQVLPMALALRRGEEIVGVLTTGVRLEWLEQKVMERGLPPGGSVTIADRNGVILARNPDPQKFVGTSIPERYQYLVNAPDPGTVEVTSQDGTKRIMGYTPVSAGNPLYVSTGVSEAEAFAPINRATLTGLVMMVVGAALAFFAAIFVGNTFILHPITHVVSVLQQWRDGNVTARTRMKGQYGELGQVGAAVDGLLDELEVRRCEARRSEEKRLLMAKELAHRVKNTLTVVQAIARQTFRRNSEDNTIFAQRIGALAGAYDVLLSQDWKSAEMRDIVQKTLLPHGGEHDPRIVLSGPACLVPSEAALALTLITHELATNAIKYGALSEPDGRLTVRWSQSDDRIHFEWMERGGPIVVASGSEGFGSKLIRNAFPATFDPQAKTVFAEAGLEFNLSFRLAAMFDTASEAA